MKEMNARTQHFLYLPSPLNNNTSNNNDDDDAPLVYLACHNNLFRCKGTHYFYLQSWRNLEGTFFLNEVIKSDVDYN